MEGPRRRQTVFCNCVRDDGHDIFSDYALNLTLFLTNYFVLIFITDTSPEPKTVQYVTITVLMLCAMLRTWISACQYNLFTLITSL